MDEIISYPYLVSLFAFGTSLSPSASQVATSQTFCHNSYPILCKCTLSIPCENIRRRGTLVSMGLKNNDWYFIFTLPYLTVGGSNSDFRKKFPRLQSISVRV